jgi:hypothetical protein
MAFNLFEAKVLEWQSPLISGKIGKLKSFYLKGVSAL